MARSQGDSYKTWTDHSLNEYKWRLREKKLKIIDHHEKWFRCGSGWILTEEANRIVNPNGSWKWDGWEIEAHEYWVTVFPEECVVIKDGKPVVIGWSQVRKVIDDDRAKANEFFKEAQRLARTLTTWHPADAEEDKLYFDYEGRKQKAKITINWDGDTYYYGLYIDGEHRLNAYTREECEQEAHRIGAELVETHTP